MNEATKSYDQWQQEATAAAIKAARSMALASPALRNTPIGRLTESQWGWIVTAAIFDWIRVRIGQAINEGRDGETFVRSTGLAPDPCDVAVVQSILPELADTAGIDWSQPLASWAPAQMTNFLLLAWRLLEEAKALRDHGPGTIAQPGKRAEEPGKPGQHNDELEDDIPFS
jgi:hypothetical protein